VCARERGTGRQIAFLYVVPNFQNPTGVLTTLERRQQLLDWATEHDLLIVEDDPYGALYFDDVATADETRPIKARDADGRVIYLSSFSKTVAPGLRVAWITAPATIIAKLEIAKQSADLCTSSLDQRIIFEMLRCGALERRLPILRDCYKRKRTVMERAIRREFRDRLSWIEPKGGFFVWTLFPPGVDTDALLPRAIAHGVVYVPGSAFFVERQDPRTARLAFSGSSSEQIERGIARLADALQEEMRARGVSDGRRATA
jgi:2-aminoadipate transaminase